MCLCLGQGTLGLSLGPVFLSMTPSSVLFSAHTWANDSLTDRPDQGMGLLETRNGSLVRALLAVWGVAQARIHSCWTPCAHSQHSSMARDLHAAVLARACPSERVPDIRGCGWFLLRVGVVVCLRTVVARTGRVVHHPPCVGRLSGVHCGGELGTA